MLTECVCAVGTDTREFSKWRVSVVERVLQKQNMEVHEPSSGLREEEGCPVSTESAAV